MKSTSYAYSFFAGLIAVAAIVFAVAFYSMQASPSVGSTIASAVPKVATSSTIQVGPQGVTTLFATSSVCTGRAVSTTIQPIMLSFSGAILPSATVGHFQGTSTNSFYNNGDYGCGAVTAYGFVASTTVTISAFAQ